VKRPACSAATRRSRRRRPTRFPLLGIASVGTGRSGSTGSTTPNRPRARDTSTPPLPDRPVFRDRLAGGGVRYGLLMGGRPSTSPTPAPSLLAEHPVTGRHLGRTSAERPVRCRRCAARA
jgi:hypothetical protein